MTNKSKGATYEIEALDTLFFRDARPFAKGEENWAQTIFPPGASVFYGALRTQFFARDTRQLDLASTDSDPTKNLKITGLYINAGNLPYFPMPADCVQKKDHQDPDGEKQGLPMELYQEPGIRSSCSLKFLLMYNGQETVEEIAGGYLDKEELFSYLRKEKESFNFIQLNEHIFSEPKIGIGISRTTGTSSKDGMLYRIGMLRPQDLTFMVRTQGLELPDKGIIRLGGEGKAAYFKKTKCPAFVLGNTVSRDKNTQNTMFKLYFATPAVFEKGWLPSWIKDQDQKQYTGTYHGLKVSLAAAAVSRYQTLGGFDMKNQKPKAMYRVIPPGSVYYFQLEEGTFQDAVEKFHDQRISDFYQEQGFGWAFVGKV